MAGRLIVSLFLLIPIMAFDPYIAPNQGSAWTEQEIVATRGQIRAILNDPREALYQVPAGPVSAFGGKNYTGKEIYEDFDEGHLKDAVLPDVAKFVRLAFHDCIRDSKFEQCNGCLNFDGMGVKATHDTGCYR